jgi:hypothetical protein
MPTLTPALAGRAVGITAAAVSAAPIASLLKVFTVNLLLVKTHVPHRRRQDEMLRLNAL